MKILLQITLDNGITKETQVNGTPRPEAILDLVNQLMSLQTSHSSQPAAPQQYTSQPFIPSQSPIAQAPPQAVPPQTHNYTPHQPTNHQGTHLHLAEDEYSRLKNESLTIKERLELFLSFEYKDQWFTSLDVKRDYDRVYPTINLSTVSTYLSRMYREGKLERMGNRNKRKYCIKTQVEPQQFTPEPVWGRMKTY